MFPAKFYCMQLDINNDSCIRIGLKKIGIVTCWNLTAHKATECLLHRRWLQITANKTAYIYWELRNNGKFDEYNALSSFLFIILIRNNREVQWHYERRQLSPDLIKLILACDLKSISSFRWIITIFIAQFKYHVAVY